jgi:Leucine-rich repeat (LRR) protein/uncharacterized protein YfaP (DUF2135 family)
MDDVFNPEISLVAPLGVVADSSVTFTAQVRDPSGVTAVKINNIAVTAGADSLYSTALSLKRGANAVTVFAQDGSSHANDTTVSFTITYDPTASDSESPAIQLTSHNSGQILTASPVMVTVNVSDDNGVAWVKINNTAVTGTDGAFSRSLSLNPGDNAVQVIAQDSSARRNKDTLNFTLVYNPSPMANAVDTVQATEDNPTPQDINLSGSDTPGSVLKWFVVKKARKGTLSIDTGTVTPGVELTYTPKPDSCGIDTFTYVVNDGFSSSAEMTVRVAIAAVNDGPTITGQDSLSVNEDAPLTIPAAKLRISDIDNVYPTDFTVIALAGANYTVSGPATILPAKDFNGSLSVNVKVFDGHDTSAVYALAVKVTPVNDPPTLTFGSGVDGSSFDFGSPIHIKACYSDPENLATLAMWFDGDSCAMLFVGLTSGSFDSLWTPAFGPHVVGRHCVRMRVVDVNHAAFEDSVVVNVTGTWRSDSLSLQTWLSKDSLAKKVTDVATATDAAGRVTTVNMGGLSIKSFPAELGNLTELKKFVVSGSSPAAMALPAEIKSWKKLDTLSINNVPLATFPPEIGSLTSLKSISMTYCPLKSLPEEFGKLTNLTRLSIGYSSLASLPASFGNLSNLTSLSIGYCSLTSVPSSIGNLSKLTSLDIGYSSLTSLPAEIGNLSNLKTLSLIYNQITALPVEIGKLSSLTALSLYGAKLTSLPAEIGNLSNLTSIDLSYNRVTSLPAAIGDLSNLTNLSLGTNQLTTLPAEIGNLSKLKTLALSYNALTSLPDEIAKLSSVTSVAVAYNPSLPKVGDADWQTWLDTYAPGWRTAK